MESCSNKGRLLGTTVVTTCNALSNFLMGVHTQVENSFVKSTIRFSRYHVQLATLHHRESMSFQPWFDYQYGP
jgi:hypothetical protein